MIRAAIGECQEVHFVLQDREQNVFARARVRVNAACLVLGMSVLPMRIVSKSATILMPRSR